MAKLISGLAIAKEIRQELKQHIIEWEIEGHRAPHLTAILIGDDPASHTYVNNKIKVGIKISVPFLSQTVLCFPPMKFIHWISFFLIKQPYRQRLKLEFPVKQSVFHRQSPKPNCSI